MVYIPNKPYEPPTKEELKRRSDEFGKWCYEEFTPKLMNAQKEALENRIMVSDF